MLDTDASAASAGGSGLAARRVIIGTVLGIATAAAALGAGASWSAAALCASDIAALLGS